MKNPPTNIGVDPQDPERCIIHVPVDIEYLKKQRKTLVALSSVSLMPDERKEMQHLVGLLDHLIFGVFYIVAEYPTANRTYY